MTAVFADPFAQLQAASDAAARLAEARSAGVASMERLERSGDDLAVLAGQIDEAIVTVKGMTE